MIKCEEHTTNKHNSCSCQKRLLTWTRRAKNVIMYDIAFLVLFCMVGWVTVSSCIFGIEQFHPGEKVQRRDLERPRDKRLANCHTLG